MALITSGEPASYIATRRSLRTARARCSCARTFSRCARSFSRAAVAASSWASFSPSSASTTACFWRRAETSPIIESIAAFCSAIVAASELWLSRTCSSLPCVASSFSCGVAAGALDSSVSASVQRTASSSAANSSARRLAVLGWVSERSARIESLPAQKRVRQWIAQASEVPLPL